MPETIEDTLKMAQKLNDRAESLLDQLIWCLNTGRQHDAPLMLMAADDVWSDLKDAREKDGRPVPVCTERMVVRFKR